jgi:hypothetical protein
MNCINRTLDWNQWRILVDMVTNIPVTALGNSWVAEQLVAFQNGVSSAELVSYWLNPWRKDSAVSMNLKEVLLTAKSLSALDTPCITSAIGRPPHLSSKEGSERES